MYIPCLGKNCNNFAESYTIHISKLPTYQINIFRLRLLYGTEMHACIFHPLQLGQRHGTLSLTDIQFRISARSLPLSLAPSITRVLTYIEFGFFSTTFFNYPAILSLSCKTWCAVGRLLPRLLANAPLLRFLLFTGWSTATHLIPFSPLLGSQVLVYTNITLIRNFPQFWYEIFYIGTKIHSSADYVHESITKPPKKSYFLLCQVFFFFFSCFIESAFKNSASFFQ